MSKLIASSTGDEEWEQLVAAARGGSQAALAELVTQLQRYCFNLALRFLGHYQDAEDASQEILVKVVTRLSDFRGESRLLTWVYRIAINHLYDSKPNPRYENINYDVFSEDLLGEFDPPQTGEMDPETAQLAAEIRVNCSIAQLQCLDREGRMAFILGEVFELDHQDAARALDISPANYRKRLSRARDKVNNFMLGHCGLVDPANPCRCSRKVLQAQAKGRVDPKRLLFGSNRQKLAAFPQALRQIRSLDRLQRASALYRAQGEETASTNLAEWLQGALSAMEVQVRDQSLH